MSNTIIKVENLSKQYRLGTVSTGTLSHDLNRWWHRVRGNEDPYLKVGETNDRTQKGSGDYVWALRDINFSVNNGDVVGIIGRNGAGKSTLLKILSRTTSPTTGSVKIKGRIASLLEVGTGFHPELTGRENIFLNGAIMGMTKNEITRKFDEIVDFAGVERYIETPVKRYSSGMYVRLAFAVAAHLEPEILIVDEVLAVGDAEFQKKALGKMRDVSGKEGRTVLFVSHNMAAIKNLCTKGILMEKGGVSLVEEIDTVIEKYFLDRGGDELSRKNNEAGSGKSSFTDWKIINGTAEYSCYSRQECHFSFQFNAAQVLKKVELGFVLRDQNGEMIYSTNSRDQNGDFFTIERGNYTFDFKVRLPLRHGKYEIDIVLVSEGKIIDQWLPQQKFSIISLFDSVLNEKWAGILNEPSLFNYEKIH